MDIVYSRDKSRDFVYEKISTGKDFTMSETERSANVEPVKLGPASRFKFKCHPGKEDKDSDDKLCPFFAENRLADQC
jgi:hypothetical protein